MEDKIEIENHTFSLRAVNKIKNYLAKGEVTGIIIKIGGQKYLINNDGNFQKVFFDGVLGLEKEVIL
jgi:hypothetical protein